MWAMVLKEVRQVRRDRRTLAMMIVMPIILLVVFGYAASFDVASIEIAFPAGAPPAVSALPDLFQVVETDRTDPTEILQYGDADVVVTQQGAGFVASVDGSQLFVARATVQAFTTAAAQGLPVTVEILFNPELDTSAVLVPGLAGLVLLFVGSLITSLGVVRERQAGTLEQLAVMPLRPRDVFVGKIAPYFVIAAIDMAIVLTVGWLLFDVPFNGSIWVLALGAVLFLFVTLGSGVLISTVSENQGQAIQLALMTLLPQVLLSGLIFPLDSMAPGIRWIGYLLPLTYFNQISRSVLLKGAPIGAVALPLLFLAGLGLAVFGLAVVRFRADLAPARIREAATS